MLRCPGEVLSLSLSEDSLVPLYRQVMDGITADIENGIYVVGARIPSEAELSEIYSVSRITVRRAVKELASEGLLTKKQGKGTFVNTPKLSEKIFQSSLLETFPELCSHNGRTPSFELAGREIVHRDDVREKDFFTDREDYKLIRVLRTLRADGVAFAFEDAVFPYEGFEFLLEADLTVNPLYELVGEKTGRHCGDGSFTRFDLARATKDVAGYLEIAEGEPLWIRYRRVVDEASQPLYTSKCFIVGSLYSIGIPG